MKEKNFVRSKIPDWQYISDPLTNLNFIYAQFFKTLDFHNDHEFLFNNLGVTISLLIAVAYLVDFLSRINFRFRNSKRPSLDYALDQESVRQQYQRS